MATIQTSIMMADNISSTLHSITSALNMTISAFQGMNTTAEQDINVGAFSAIREHANAATLGIQNLDRELASLQPRAAPVEVTPTWNNQSSIDIFQNAGADRLTLEMSSLNDITNEVLNNQRRLGEQALNMELLPPNASWDINEINQRIADLGQRMSELQNVDTSMLDDASINRMNAEYENMRQGMNSIINLQESMNTAIEQGDVSRLNEGYNQLNGVAEQFEQRVRSNMAVIQEMNTIEWRTQANVEIFSGNDTTRYSQEIQSANNMLSRLTSTQQQISQQAATMRLLPPQALTDINSMGERITALRAQIEQVQQSRIEIVGVERANAEVEQLRQQLNQAVQVQEQMNHALGEMDVSGANQAYDQLNSIIDSTERHIRDNINEQEAFNEELEEGQSAAEGLKGIIAGIVGAFTVGAAVDWIKESIDMTNGAIQAEQQLTNVLANQGATQEDLIALKEKAEEIESKTMFDGDDILAGAAELATYMSDTEALMKSMDTLANYAAGMSGGAEVGTQEMVNYATQMGKALDGMYEGLNKKGFGLTDAQKEIIDNGTDMQRALVIDDVINQSWADLAEQMAKTPHGMMVVMKNAFNNIREGFGAQLLPVIMKVNQIIVAHMPQIERFIYSFIPPIQIIISLMGGILEAAFAVYQFFSDNWSMIAPIIFGIAAAWGVYALAVNGAKLAEMAQAAWTSIVTAAKVVAAGVTMTLTGATAAQTAAQWGLNAALLACPLVWIVVMIVVLIAAIYAGVAAFNHFAGESVSATGIIAGVFAALGAYLWNTIAYLWNIFAGIAEFWANVWNNPMYSVRKLFGDLIKNVLDMLISFTSGWDEAATNMANSMIDGINSVIRGLNWLIDKLNTIPGIDIGNVQEWEHVASITSTFEDMKGGIDKWIGEKPENYWEAPKMDMIALSDAWNTGYGAGVALENSIGEMLNFGAFEPSDMLSGVPAGNDALAGAAGDAAEAAKETAQNTGKMEKMSEEDLKYLRDIAERETINRFTTAEVKVEFGGINNNVSSDVDLDSIVNYISEHVGEALLATAEGVHV